MDGLEPEGREEEVGEGGGRAATEAGSQHVREGGGSVGVKVGGRKAVTVREPRQRKKANKLRERAYPCTFTGEPLGEGVIAPEFLDEDGGSESSKGTGKGNRKPGWQFRELLILLNRNCAQKNFIPSRWTVSRDTVVYAAAALQSAIAEMLAKEGELGCRVSVHHQHVEVAQQQGVASGNGSLDRRELPAAHNGV
ncbi:unnamed protein product [Closterium sp. NIES-65]|nr:unnamed protein product [Closterium sp. NIES-65]